ncbi:MAG: phenylalanine--tRNA ligase beta subunit-related protein, partial [Flavobacteriales bacterium]
NSIFLESAYFNPPSIRKTSSYHGLVTDASFRFERGCDPDITVYALKRAALLIKELAGGETTEIMDKYPKKIPHEQVNLKYSYLNKITGKEYSSDEINHILDALEINIEKKNEEEVLTSVPSYRVDVKRPADLVEEILRIKGFNTIPVSETVS